LVGVMVVVSAKGVPWSHCLKLTWVNSRRN